MMISNMHGASDTMTCHFLLLTLLRTKVSEIRHRWHLIGCQSKVSNRKRLCPVVDVRCCSLYIIARETASSSAPSMRQGDVLKSLFRYFEIWLSRFCDKSLTQD